MKHLLPLIFFIFFTFGCNNQVENNEPTNTAEESSKLSTVNTNGEIIYLNKETFRKKIFDFDKKDFVYVGSKPCIVECFATWCGPCKMLAPLLEDAAHTYAKEINVYKIDVDKEQELASMLGISSIPVIFFFPMKGQPIRTEGFMQKEALTTNIHKLLLKTDSIHEQKGKI